MAELGRVPPLLRLCRGCRQFVRVDRTTGLVEPRLAREWSSSPDGLTWVFTLEEGVTFSDGTPFTSADVVFSFRALYDPAEFNKLLALLVSTQGRNAREIIAEQRSRL